LFGVGDFIPPKPVIHIWRNKNGDRTTTPPANSNISDTCSPDSKSHISIGTPTVNFNKASYKRNMKNLADVSDSSFIQPINVSLRNDDIIDLTCTGSQLQTKKNRLSTKSRTWIKPLNLFILQKQEIIHNDWLSDTHMSAFNTVMKKQFPNMHGFQHTGYVPQRITLDGKTDRWTYPIPLAPARLPYVQIHHNGANHWVMSYAFKNRKLIVLDSMNKGTLQESLQVQFGYIYSDLYKDHAIHVIMPFVNQQVGSTDCGIYAIANAVEVCMGGYSGILDSTTKMDWEFDQPKMRDHLITCFEKQEFTPFPKKSCFGPTIKLESFHILCSCIMCLCPDIMGDLIRCDLCDRLFHRRCVNVGRVDKEKCPMWFCLDCVSVSDADSD